MYSSFKSSQEKKKTPFPHASDILRYFVLAVCLPSEISSLISFTLITADVVDGMGIGSNALKGAEFIPWPVGLHLLNLPNFI